MTSRPVQTTAAEILQRVEEDGVEFIRFWFTDILGQLKSFAVGKDQLPDALAEGMGFDGSSITGFNRIEESDMIAMPDPDTYTVLPWRTGEDTSKGAVARLFCNILVPGGEPYVGDPRFVMHRALERMRALGFDEYFIGPELEFFYFASDQLNEDGVPVPLDRGGYFDLTTLDAASDLRRDTINALRAVGIEVEYSHHEVGPSQHEIDMRYQDGLRMSDDAMTYRIVVKEIASTHGVYATFMPKPLFGENGSGMHVHQSLFKDGRNAFYDESARYHLSDTARHFIAGLLRHSRELSALFAPNVNSYKRLVPGYEAPVYTAWSQRNRSALVRVPMYQPGKEQGTRCELRCPDPSCNPYLTFAALLQAGLEGIEHKYDIPEPMDTNLYELTPDQLEERGIQQLPATLGEAIEEMASSEFVRAAIGDHIFDRYIELKRAEWNEYRVQVSRWELERYLPVL
ncbi:MAG TPA: type I glutamate--ammonia ligase [Solirubrobacterales bacterium]|nr:type I glutamate--ammonia ligase [Solirubrobacterales bacterium]